MVAGAHSGLGARRCGAARLSPEPLERAVRVRGEAHRVWESGTGEPLGYLAGLGGLPRWTPFLRRLAERSRLVAPSLPGFPGALGHTRLDDLSDWIASVLDLLEACGLEGSDLIGASVGTLVGIVAGYFGGFLDNLLMRIADLVLGIPLILVAIVLVTVTGASTANIIFIVSAFVWPRYARIIRSETLSLREQDYVMLARVAGISSRRIMFRHILPNVVSTLIVLCTLQVGQVVLLESALSFLGVGIPPPKPSWGIMVADGRTNLTSGWWISLTPGLAIVLLVISFNLVGDWLRDRLDPRLQRY